MTDFAPVFADLRGIMLPYAKYLVCTVDGEGELYLDTKHIQGNKKPLWFGAVHSEDEVPIAEVRTSQASPFGPNDPSNGGRIVC